MIQCGIKSAYQAFVETADPYLNIGSKDCYLQAQNLLKDLYEDIQGSESHYLNGLISLVGEAIDDYERSTRTDKQTDALSSRHHYRDIQVLKKLMSEHRLGLNDLPEIGSRSHISKILTGNRNLTKEHIRKLSIRFGKSPAIFF